jgi:hypothetical protein
MIALPTTAPASFRAGDSAAWKTALPDYPSTDGWSLIYRLIFPGSAVADIPATGGTGGDYTIALSATVTSAWPAGPGTLVSRVDRGSGAGLERLTLNQQAVVILPNLATANNFDGRSANVKALADARAALAQYMANGQMHVAEYEIAGRRMKFRSAQEIIDLIAYYEREVAKERAAAALMQGIAPGRIYTRF